MPSLVANRNSPALYVPRKENQMAYWEGWHGCCDCTYGVYRGDYDLRTYGATFCPFRCERKDTTASIYKRPEETCESYNRKEIA